MSAALKLENQNPLLNSEVITSFAKSVKDTITTMTNTKLTPEKPYIEYKFEIQSEIAGILGVASDDHKGLFVVSFSKEAILSIHNNMLGESETELSDSVCDVVGELSNMIYGSSKTTLNEKGYNLKMAIPTVSKGNFRLTSKSQSLTVVMPFLIEDKYKFLVALTVE